MANRLAKETSPYLRQHQDNPVDWYPWGDEALERAKKEDKPILLSVGYSACHWCHVMAHESFENPDIAKLMNAMYINIKVDREERPDLDQIYQNVAQIVTQGGGWPLTVFLTPDLKPFFGGTYFPPEDKYGRPGFPRVLMALADAYKNEKQKVMDQANQLAKMIHGLENVFIPPGEEFSPLSSDRLYQIGKDLMSYIDLELGGTQGAPKFPNTMLFSFLWRLGQIHRWQDGKDATLVTLRKMAQGGIFDQLGGGFHRYSVDSQWAVPHFEKMLYDNALLLKLYSEVLLSEEKLSDEDRKLFRDVVSSTVEYIAREMTSPEGGFFAAQDADSEGEEGKYFVWDKNDLSRLLTHDEAQVFALRFGVSEGGNFEHGKTVLHLDQSVAQVSKSTGIAEPDVEALLQSAREELLEARSKRVAPGRDDKILTGWNGLMISGLAWAAKALEQEGAKATARKASDLANKTFEFAAIRLVRSGNSHGEDRLYCSLQDGQAKLNGYLDDYAFMAMAAIDVARVSDDSVKIDENLLWARKWVDVILRHFKDSEKPGYFFTSDDHEALIQRPKTVFDQAIPSGTAVTLACMAVLAEIDLEGSGARYEEELQYQISQLFPAAQKNPYGCGELLCTSLLTMQGPVVVSGPKANDACRHPHIFQKADMGAQRGQFLVCHRKTCGLPLKSAEQLRLEASKKATSTVA